MAQIKPSNKNILHFSDTKDDVRRKRMHASCEKYATNKRSNSQSNNRNQCHAKAAVWILGESQCLSI